MARKEAEAKYGASIYDSIKPPEDLQELNIFHIPDWNTNAVKDGDFLSSTGALNAIEVQRLNHRPQKTHVEFCFEIVPDDDKRSAELRADVSALNTASGQTTTNPAVAVRVKCKSPTMHAEDLSDFFFLQLEKAGIILNDQQQKQNLRRTLLDECELTLNTVQNAGYAAGFKAAK